MQRRLVIAGVFVLAVFLVVEILFTQFRVFWYLGYFGNAGYILGSGVSFFTGLLAVYLVYFGVKSTKSKDAAN